MLVADGDTQKYSTQCYRRTHTADVCTVPDPAWGPCSAGLVGLVALCAAF
jgi:hypothetical protein